MIHRSAGAVVIGVLGLAMLAACAGPTTQPEPTELPEVVWEQEGTSPLESDPWVEAERASQLGHVLAVNTMDFTLEEFTSTRLASQVRSEYATWDATFGPAAARRIQYAGPLPTLPLAVVEAPDGMSAELELCDVSEGWFVSTDQPESHLESMDGVIVRVTMTRDEDEDVVWRSLPYRTADTCDATGAPVGVFDPAPVLPVSIDEDDVRPPLGDSAD